MSRHLSGSLRGVAARTELRDLMEAEQEKRARFGREWNQTAQALEYFMGSNCFDQFFDSFPENMSRGEFLPIMKAKLEEVDGALQDTYARIDQVIGTEPIKQTDYDDLAEIL